MKILFTFCLVSLASCLLFTSCNPSAEVKILGAWRIDSIYDNYNGFGFTNTNPSPQEVYEYRKDNTVLRKGMGEQLVYQYQLRDSILLLTDASRRPGDEYIILHVDQNNLALKKNKKPLFPGKNQVRYEVRYFTKIDSAGLKR
jgi:hypothetical protein